MNCYNTTCAWIHNQRCENSDAIRFDNCTGRVKENRTVSLGELMRMKINADKRKADEASYNQASEMERAESARHKKVQQWFMDLRTKITRDITIKGYTSNPLNDECPVKYQDIRYGESEYFLMYHSLVAWGFENGLDITTSFRSPKPENGCLGQGMYEIVVTPREE